MRERKKKSNLYLYQFLKLETRIIRSVAREMKKTMKPNPKQTKCRMMKPGKTL
jgi:hypothetical protein